ncbi:MAG TPA: flagellar biosynthetic protein FliO [Rhodocyclaceae bacterium]|jgi:flagellar protein FliO/FliZ|nr:flagellar biosynthetic protein FliO [Rhodocyclaceae bacterium]
MRFLPIPVLFFGLLSNAFAQIGPSAASAAASTQPSLGGSFLQMLFGLALVLCLLFAGFWLLKKLTGSAGVNSSLVRVVGATAIGARERIVIVEAGSTWLILGVTPNSITTLAEMPRQPLPPGMTPNAPDFARWVSKLMNRNAR